MSSTLKCDDRSSTGNGITSNKNVVIHDTDGANPPSKSPYELYLEKLISFTKKKGFLGTMLIKGIERKPKKRQDRMIKIKRGDSGFPPYRKELNPHLTEEELKGKFKKVEDEDEEDESEPTDEQMSSLRFIMINKNRKKQLESMRKLVLGDEDDQPFMMFSTSFSYRVLGCWDHVEDELLPRKSPARKLDILLAFTHTLLEDRYWIHDNEGDMGEVVEGLGKAWKKLIKRNSDEKLGWDKEYTKPGIMELLRQFQSAIDDVDSDYEMGEFKYM